MDIELREPISDLVGAYPDRALLVCGSARCLWDDLAKIKPELYDIMAVNFTGLFYPDKVTHWVSGYSHLLKHWRGLRWESGWVVKTGFKEKEPLITHGRNLMEGVDHAWSWRDMGQGTSTLDAAMIGVLMGYNHVILAGAPLDKTGHFYDPPGYNSGDQQPDYWDGIIKVWKLWKDRGVLENVKSLSGNTRKILGAPVGLH